MYTSNTSSPNTKTNYPLDISYVRRFARHIEENFTPCEVEIKIIRGGGGERLTTAAIWNGAVGRHGEENAERKSERARGKSTRGPRRNKGTENFVNVICRILFAVETKVSFAFTYEDIGETWRWHGEGEGRK